jgi:hypothetical protein
VRARVPLNAIKSSSRAESGRTPCCPARCNVSRALREGKYKGRKPTARAKLADIIKLAGEGMKREDIASRLNVGVASVYRALAERRSRRRVGWCEFSARLFFHRPRSCRRERPRVRAAASYDRKSSVTYCLGTKAYFFRSLRISLRAACLLRLD